MRIIRKGISILSILLVVLSLFALIRFKNEWMQNSREFAIQSIEVSGIDLINSNYIMELSGLTPGQNIWSVDLQKAKTDLDANPFIERVTLQRKLPNILEVRVEEKKPIASLNFQGELFCIDKDGLILPSKPGKLYNMPVISGDFEGGVRVGSRASGPMVMKGLEFLKLIIEDRPEIYDQISQVVPGDARGLTVYTSKRGIAVVIGSGREIQKIRYLEAALAEIEKDPDIGRIRYIDLRYRGQVVIGMRA